METGELITLYRKQAGMTIDDLAAKSGVPKGTLNKIIGGTTKAPTLDNMKAIARALGKALADFDDAPSPERSLQSVSTAEMTHIKKYRALDQDGKDTVEAVLDCEHKRCTRRPNIVTEPTVLKFAGRDGSFREYTLSPQELEALRQKLAELPDASDDL